MEDRRLLQNLIYKLSRTRWRNFNRLIGARCKSTGDKQEEMTEIAGGRRRESLRASKDDVFRKVWRKTICFYKLTYAKKGRETIFLLFLKLRLDSQMSSFWRNRFSYPNYCKLALLAVQKLRPNMSNIWTWCFDIVGRKPFLFLVTWDL